MRNKLAIPLIAGMILVMAVSLVSADLIMPGYHPINIENRIVNINDFPDYVFVSSGHESLPSPTMCPMKVIMSDGIVTSYYKFCSVAVYAIEKSKFAEFNEILAAKILELNEPSPNWTQVYSEYKAYFSDNSIKIIGGLHTSIEVPDSDIRESITNEYVLNPDLTVKEKEVVAEKNFLLYIYIIAPIVAIILIVLYLLKRKEVTQ